MPPDDVNAIWNACKDMGVLLGKGGIHLNVSKKGICVILVECLPIGVNKHNSETQKLSQHSQLLRDRSH